jgi:hypothetical protein
MTGSGPPETTFFDQEVTPDPLATGSGAEHFDHADDADDDLDSEFAPQPRKRLGKLTIALAALLVAGAGFLAGLQVQKHEGSSSTANPFAAAAARRGNGGTGGTGAGGGFGNFGGGTGATSGGSAGAGGTGTTTANIPAVIGQIVSISGDTVVVKNLGGKEITVKLADSTTISQVATAADLKAGQNVTVSGTTAADGTVTATSVGTR